MNLREQLESLGLRKGVAGLRRDAAGEGLDIHHLVPGEVVSTPLGNFFLHEERYPLDYRHGQVRLGQALEADPSRLARLLGDARVGGLDLRRALYVDTETTGLAGGTGTYAFLVGVGFFAGDHFRILQFFMRDYHEEMPLLHRLAGDFGEAPGLVTFNGRNFDVPLLHTRWIAARMPPAWADAPHLDLLPPSRRVWRARLDSCSLASLERHILGVERTSDDVPGWMVPSLYFRYVQTRDAREMKRVLYHNVQDILSLVTLAWVLADLTAQPLAPSRHHMDCCSLAEWLERLGELEEAEALYWHALEGPLPVEQRRRAMLRLSLLLKRQGRREEAVPLWMALADDPEAGLTALEELAKWEEWHHGDLRAALQWARRGLQRAGEWRTGHARRRAQAEFRHRVARLEGKLGL
ncbi:MAG: tetratricopeptide repeat protein [Anaerolineae bacterium]|nr:tetratricopeptide repeat protein [Anaerolineae bacterium]